MPDPMPGLRFRILGELHATHAGISIQLGSRQQRAVLVALILEAGRPLTVDRLVDRLWGSSAPPGAVSTIHSYVSRLRRLLPDGAAILETTPAGYALRINRSQVDAYEFEDLADRGRDELDQGRLRQADDLLTQALGLWRGSCLPDLVDHPVAQTAIDRLEGLRLLTIEDASDVALALGRPAVVISTLEQLLQENPLRERMWAQLILALYQTGRQADALASLRTVRRLLADQLGVDPGPALRRLENQVLAQDSALDPWPQANQALRSTPERADPPSTKLRQVRSLFVGRDTELGVLSTLLMEADAGHGQVAVVSGEPGVGKTELARQAASLASGRGALVMWGRCGEEEGQPALWAWLQVLRTVRDGVGLPPGPHLDPLRALLGAEHGTGTTSRPAPLVFGIAQGVTRLLSRLGENQCLLVVLDDVHAADPTSLELLRALAIDVPRLRLLVLMTHRNGPEATRLTETLALLARHGTTTTVGLQGLDEAAVGQLLETRGEATPGLAHTIWDRTEGNPFFVSEVLRAPAHVTMHHPTSYGEHIAVPAGVRDVLRGRLLHMPHRTFELLGAAAILGREFQLAVLAETTGLSRLECATTLEPAMISGLVTTCEAGMSRLRFAHALVRETLLGDLSPVRAANLHARCAQALMRGPEASMDDAEPVAHHVLASSGLVGADQAVPVVLRAADVALSRSAHGAADRMLAAANELLSKEPAGSRQPTLELEVVVRRVRLRLLNRGFGVPDLPTLTRRALDLSAHTDRAADVCEVLAAAAITALAEGDRFTAQGLVQQGLDLAADSVDPRAQHTAHQAAARVAFNTGQITVARAELSTCLDIISCTRVEEAAASWAHDTVAPRYFTLGLAAFTEWIVGDASAADMLIDQCRAESEYLDDPVARQLPLYLGAGIAMWSNDYQRCLQLVDRSLREPEHLQAPYFRSAAQVLRASSVAHLGDPVAGLRDITTAYGLMVETKALPWTAYAQALHAEVLLLAGDRVAALTVSAEAVAAIASDGDPYAAEILRIHGGILAADPASVAVAIEVLHEGVRLAQDQGAHGFLRRLRTTLEQMNLSGIGPIAS